MRALFQVAVASLAIVVGPGLGLGALGRVWARPPVVAPEIEAEREALIGKIARGEDFEASVARFSVLYKELIGRREAAVAAEQQERERLQRELQELAALKTTLDYLVGEYCYLRADPRQPPEPKLSIFLRGDWGKVVGKEQVAIKGRTAFDPDEPVTVYRVQGGERTYTLSSKSPTLHLGKGLQAEMGDLVLLCWIGLSQHGSGGYYPVGFRDNVISQGFAARIAAPPLIASKTSWDPIHLTGESALRLAIDRVTWELPVGRPVLSHLRVLTDLGQGRFEIAAQNRSYVLEVPSGLKNRELVKPGKYLWAIMSTPRFDKEIKKLVLRAEDLAAHYVQPVE